MSTAYLVQYENTAEFLAIIGRLHPIDDDRVKAMPASRLTSKIFSRPTTVHKQQLRCWGRYCECFRI